MPDFVVSTAFTAKDGVTQTFKNMSAGAKRFGNSADTAFSRASRRATSFGAITKGILTAGVIQRGFGLMQQGIRKVVTEFISFDDAITAAAAKFDGIERGTKVFEELKTVAREVGATTEFTSAQAAEGLRFLAKAGFEPAFAMRSLKSFVDLATASELEFARATDIATDVMGAFGLNVEDTDDRLKNLVRVNDVLAKATNMANIDMEDLFETIKMAGPVAKTAGVSIEKFSAIAAFMGGAGIKGSLGGTAMRTAILSLTAQTPAATKVIKKMGISLVDAKKNLRDPVLIFEEMRKKMKDMGTAQRSATLAVIFGKRAIAGASVSIEGGEKALGKFEKALIDAGGESKRIADLMRKSLGKRLAALESSAIEVGFKFIDAFENKIPGGIDAAMESVRNFDVKPIINDIIAIGKFLKETWKILKDLKPALEFGLILWISYGVALKIVTGIQAVKFMLDLAKATQVAAGAQGVLNAAILANPLGMLVIAIGLLITMAVLWYKNWDEIIEVVTFFWEKTVVGFKNAWVGAGNIVSKIWRGFIELWDIVSTLFKNTWEKVPERFAQSWDLVKSAVIRVFNAIKEKAKSAIAFLNPFKEFFGGGTKTGVEIVQETIQKATSARRERVEERRVPPNVAREEARKREQIGFEGKLTVAGAPPGSTLEATTTGAPPIQTEMLGANL